MCNQEAVGLNAKTNADKFTKDYMDNYLTKCDSRYVASLPWKFDQTENNDNKQIAYYRLNALCKRLVVKNRLVNYHKKIVKLIQNGFAEKVVYSEKTDKTYYMSHRGVHREDKATTKLRIVFDASSHAHGFDSLNDCLYSGDVLNVDLFSVLINFRLGKIGLVADIEKAFLQIELSTKDRDVQKFLWFEDHNGKPDTKTIGEYRMKRVTFGVAALSY